MSGRVGDLSPKQAETLAKVRAPPPGVPEDQGKGAGGGKEWLEPCPTQLIQHVLDIVSLVLPPKGSSPTVPSDINPVQGGG